MVETKRCTKCVMPSTTPGIKFDSEGVCSICRDYKLMTTKGEEKFLEILNRHRNKNNKYDCMIGVSGGRDSTFVMYKLVHDYKMRVLAAHYNNPFNSKQAIENLDNAIKQLNVDCIKWSFKKGYHISQTRKALKAWSRYPSHSMLPIICAVCKGWWPRFFQIAKENNISLIVIGSNPLESALFKEESFGGARTYYKFAKLPKIIKKGFTELIKNPRYLYSCSWSAVIKGFLMASHEAPFVRWKYKKIKVVMLFDYIRWNEQMVMSTITKNLGWKRDPEHHSPWRFDCQLDHIKKFLYKKTIGVSELEDLFSKMIREGMISRYEVIERLKTENKTPKHLVKAVLDKLDLKEKELKWPFTWQFDE